MEGAAAVEMRSQPRAWRLCPTPSSALNVKNQLKEGNCSAFMQNLSVGYHPANREIPVHEDWEILHWSGITG